MNWPSVVDELLEQRDAVLFGEWVPHYPQNNGIACTMSRRFGEDPDSLGFEAATFVAQAISLTGFMHSFDFSPTGKVITWNDCEERTKEQVVSVLDEAIRLAKGAPCPAKPASRSACVTSVPNGGPSECG